jgi:hypothetical protein
MLRLPTRMRRRVFGAGCVLRSDCSSQGRAFLRRGASIGKTPNSSSTWTVEIARAGDGSIYEATSDPNGEFKGSIFHIKIMDVASNCNLGISPYRSHLRKTNQGYLPGPTSGLSISVEAVKAPTSPSPTVDDIRNMNLRGQDHIRMSPQILKPDEKIRQTSLGQRTVDGMTIFGFQLEHRLGSETDRVEERWESEMGFAYSLTRTNPTSGRVSAFSLSGLKLVEPPAELFTIQDKYFPPTRALQNARSIFISGLPGNEELTRRIESILTASGRFTIAPDSRAADLVVVSRLEADTVGDQAHATFRQIRLEFNRPNGTSVFWVSLRLNGASDQGAQSPTVNTCFANLWERVESLKASSAPIDEELF